MFVLLHLTKNKNKLLICKNQSNLMNYNNYDTFKYNYIPMVFTALLKFHTL